MPIWGHKWSLQIAQTLCRQNIPLRSPKHSSLQHSAYFSLLLVQEKQVSNLHTHYFFFCHSHTQREVAQHTGTNYIPYWAGHAKDTAHWHSRGFLNTRKIRSKCFNYDKISWQMLRETSIQITYILPTKKKNTILLLKYLTFRN